MSAYSRYDLFNVSMPSEFVLHVETNRPKKLNAYNEATWTQFGAIFEQAGEDADVRVIVLSGSGRAFSAGLDVKDSQGQFVELASLEASRQALKRVRFLRQFQDDIGRPHTINKPVIAVAHGPTLGLALDILSAVDIRFASKDAQLSVREIVIGMAADIGSLQRLPKIVHDLGWLKEICYTGRIFGPEEAKQHGLIQQVLDTKEEAVAKALELAKDIAEKSPVAMHGVKRSINFAIDHSVQEGLQQIADYNAFGLGEDFILGLTSAMSKNKPRYEKL